MTNLTDFTFLYRHSAKKKKMRTSLLIVAALYELVTAGEKFLSKSTLPVCNGSNPQAFKELFSSATSQQYSFKKENMDDSIRRKMSAICDYFEDMKIEQVNEILNQFSVLKKSKFWEEDKNASLISTSYSPDTKKFSFYSFFAYPNKKEGVYSSGYLAATVRFEGFQRFQATSIYTIDRYSETSTLDDERYAENVDNLVGAIQISLLPIVLFYNNDVFQTLISPIVKTSINAIDNGKLPYGVTEENKASVREKLLSIQTNGFPSFSDKLFYDALDEKCK
jgi:hypothetical protein